MAKTYDEKREAFDRMLGTRLPKAVKAIELLANLSRKGDYAWTNADMQALMDQLDDAVDVVAEAFGVKTDGPDFKGLGPSVEDGSAKPAEGFEPVDLGDETVRREDRSEVRWAYDAIRRGDRKLAEARLKLVLDNWTIEEKS